MDQPPLLERQIGTQKIEAFKQIHINLNYPPCTLVSAFENGYIYTIETFKEPNEPENIWFCTYKLDMSLSVLDINSDNFTEHLYDLIGKGYIGPDSYKNLS
jgi:hypothetical protein